MHLILNTSSFEVHFLLLVHCLFNRHQDYSYWTRTKPMRHITVRKFALLYLVTISFMYIFKYTRSMLHWMIKHQKRVACTSYQDPIGQLV